MYQFTTPTITISIPDSVAVGDITSLVVTILQGNIRIEKELTDVILDSTENTITMALTQAETGSFVRGEVQVQCHILVGSTAYATNIMSASVYENIHAEAIE